MIPNYREIADAEHMDHLERLEAMKQPRREGGQVVVLILASAFLGICLGVALVSWALS